MSGRTGSLTITRGLPASGKSTWAKEWVAEDPTWRARVNRDDLRAMLFNKPVLDRMGEEAVTLAQHALVRSLLGGERAVVVDDTNLRLKYARAWADLARECGAAFTVNDTFTEVPLETCIERDWTRHSYGHRYVGEDVIRGMHDRFLKGGRKLPPVVASEITGPALYEPDTSLPAAWLVDIDGTLARMSERSPFAWDRVGEDALIEHVAEVVKAIAGLGNPYADGFPAIVAMSGRDAVCRPETETWLDTHGIPYVELHMRPEGDMRKDSIVKAELFDKHVRHRFNVRGVLDDRDQVVAMWRAMGLPCFQVAPGAF